MNIVENVEGTNPQLEQVLSNNDASTNNLQTNSEIQTSDSVSITSDTVSFSDNQSDNISINQDNVALESNEPILIESTPDNAEAHSPAEIQAVEVTDTTPDAEVIVETQKSKWQEKLESLFATLKEKKDKQEPIDVFVKSRIRGGFRVVYKDIPLFLPASHYSLKKTPSEQELQSAVGASVKVLVHELQDYEEGRKAVIVSRKQLLHDDFWNKIKVGDIVEGRVSSVATFGVFVDLGGVEGLIHVSRLSQIHIDDPTKLMKKGEVIRAVVIDIDKDKNRIALSRKQLEDSPWKNIEELYSVGSQHKGIVRRLTDFGVYIELKPGVDGLLRASEISWTKRIRKPSDLFSPGQEITVEVLSVSEEKQTVGLSYKKTLPNPWNQMIDKLPVGTEHTGIVSQIMPQGAIITISDDVDGFMPRSKMKGLAKGKRIPYQIGEAVQVKIADLIPDEESLILAPVNEFPSDAPPQREPRAKKFSNQPPAQDNKQKATQGSNSITFLDLLSEKDKKSMFKSVSN